METDTVVDKLLSEAIYSKDSNSVIPIYKVKRKLSPINTRPNKRRGILLLDTATYKQDNFPAIECETDIIQKNSEVNQTRAQLQLKNIGIIPSVLNKYPKVRNIKGYKLTDKHKYLKLARNNI